MYRKFRTRKVDIFVINSNNEKKNLGNYENYFDEKKRDIKRETFPRTVQVC